MSCPKLLTTCGSYYRNSGIRKFSEAGETIRQLRCTLYFTVVQLYVPSPPFGQLIYIPIADPIIENRA